MIHGKLYSKKSNRKRTVVDHYFEGTGKYFLDAVHRINQGFWGEGDGCWGEQYTILLAKTGQISKKTIKAPSVCVKLQEAWYTIRLLCSMYKILKAGFH